MLMCTIDGMRLSAILLPVWILFLFMVFAAAPSGVIASCPRSPGRSIIVIVFALSVFCAGSSFL
ncbi:hypothetical protein DMH17_07240 [Raoultella planticola]|nr:hypothetical protein [Raoultella planticola]